MKTTKISSVISLLLILVLANSVYSKGRTTDNRMQGEKKGIRYEVTIHLSQTLNFCNTYLVRVTDEYGRPVAQPQVYVPGISKYVFNETVAVPAKIRVASLSLPENIDPYFCTNNLVTKSDPVMGPFFTGQTYSFDLYPIIEKKVVGEN
jgi:hypothetical protein